MDHGRPPLVRVYLEFLENAFRSMSDDEKEGLWRFVGHKDDKLSSLIHGEVCETVQSSAFAGMLRFHSSLTALIIPVKVNVDFVHSFHSNFNALLIAGRLNVVCKILPTEAMANHPLRVIDYIDRLVHIAIRNEFVGGAHTTENFIDGRYFPFSSDGVGSRCKRNCKVSSTLSRKICV